MDPLDPMSLFLGVRCSLRLVLRHGLRFQIHEHIARQFEAEPAAGHTGRHFEEVWYKPFVHSRDTFLGDDGADGVEDRFVLVAHAGHGVDLESSS